MKILYVVGKAFPAGECRYLIRRRSDAHVVADDIEDRMYAALLCEAFNLLGERAEAYQAANLVPRLKATA